MDINFKLDNITFNFRVACLIRKDNEVLLEYNPEYNYYSFIGGRVKIGEDTPKAIKREFLEETGLNIQVNKLRGLVENFFVSQYKNSLYHELLYIYDCTLLENIITPIPNLEDKNRLFKWVDINILNETNFRPASLIDNIKENTFFNIINRD